MVTIQKGKSVVMNHLRIEYERKGRNFLFNARKLKIKGYSTHLTGNILGKLYSSGNIEKCGTEGVSPMWYTTKFPKK